jgi:hypothetical protein
VRQTGIFIAWREPETELLGVPGFYDEAGFIGTVLA